MKKLTIILSITIFLIFQPRAHAGVPLDTIQAHINHVLDVLRDPVLKGESATKSKKEKIGSIAADMFDFNGLSKRTLGKNWSKFNKEQRIEFTDLYRAILEKAYMGRIMEYTDEKIVFDKETILSKNKAEVQSRIITKSVEIPIYYRMILKNGEWQVYDIIIEGISMTRNYRSQFKEILAKKSHEELLKIMREKLGKA